MSTWVKLFALNNRVLCRLHYFNVSSLQIASTKFNKRLLSNNVVNIQQKFTKISDDLITDKPLASNEKVQRRGGEIKVRGRKEDSQMLNQDGKIIESLRELERIVLKWGKLEMPQIQRVLSAIKDELSNDECSMLLRCCGAFLIMNTPAERQLLTQQVWNLIKEKGVNLNVQVFNSLMLTNLENGQSFSPLNILNDIENVHNIVPSKTTYELLMAGFCDQGDILGARKIMEHMKSLDFPLNHFVLHYLIRGHVKSNDIEGAKNLIKSMSTHGLAITAETYRMYLLSLAEMGNVNTLQEGLSDMRSSNILLNSKSIYDIAIASSKYKHYENTTQILKLLKFTSQENTNNESLNNSLQLVVLGDFLNGLEVLKEMDLDQVSKYQYSARALKTYILNEKPVEQLFELYDLLKNNDLTDVELPLLIHWSTFNSLQSQHLNNFQYQYSLKMIKYLRLQGEEIRVLHYSPLLIHSLLSNNLEQIYFVTQQLCLNCQSKNDPILGIFSKKLLPTLDKQFNQNIDEIISKLKTFGLRFTVLDCLRVSYHIQKADFKTATQLVGDGCKFSRLYSRKQISEAYFLNKQTQELIELVLVMKRKMNEESCVEFVSMLLFNLLNHPKADANIATDIINAFKQAKLRISFDVVDQLGEILNKLKVSPQILEILVKATTKDLKDKLGLNRKDVAVEKELLFYAKKGDMPKVESLLKLLNAKEHIFSAQVLRQLGCMFASYKKDKNAALSYLNQLCSHYPDMLKYSKLLLDICTLQLVDGQHTEAMELFLKHSEKIKDKLHEDGFSDNIDYRDSCLRILQASSGKNPYANLSLQESVDTKSDFKKFQPDVWKTYDWMEALFNSGFIKRGEYQLLNFTTNLFLENDDIDALLACYERCVLRFGFAPSFSKVLGYITSHNDPEKLNKAIELTCKVFEEKEVQTKMFFIYISQKKNNEATKILQMPEFKLDFQIMFKEFNKLIQNDMEVDLLLIEEASHGSYIHSEAIFQLIKFYESKKEKSTDCDSALIPLHCVHG